MARKESREIIEGEETLLKSMFPRGKELTIKEIMKHTPYSSYERNNTYLKSLAQKQVLEEKKIGKTLVYSIIPLLWASKKAFYAYALERAMEFSDKHKTVSKALQELPADETDAVIVFGSYAKGIERKESDIDVLIVSDEKEKLETTIISLKRRYGLRLHTIIVPRSEFAKIKKENKELWNSLITYGIFFKGFELLYHHAYEN